MSAPRRAPRPVALLPALLLLAALAVAAGAPLRIPLGSSASYDVTTMNCRYDDDDCDGFAFDGDTWGDRALAHALAFQIKGQLNMDNCYWQNVSGLLTPQCNTFVSPLFVIGTDFKKPQSVMVVGWTNDTSLAPNGTIEFLVPENVNLTYAQGRWVQPVIVKPPVIIFPGPNPFDTASPAPLDSISPVPLDSASPAPLDSTSPAPLDSVSPAPLDSASPAPLDSTSPAPLDSVSPAPLGSPEPEPQPSPAQPPVCTGRTASVAIITAQTGFQSCALKRAIMRNKALQPASASVVTIPSFKDPQDNNVTIAITGATAAGSAPPACFCARSLRVNGTCPCVPDAVIAPGGASVRLLPLPRAQQRGREVGVAVRVSFSATVNATGLSCTGFVDVCSARRSVMRRATQAKPACAPFAQASATRTLTVCAK